MAKTKLTELTLPHICQMLRAGLPVAAVAEALGMNRSTVGRWIADGAEAEEGDLKRKVYLAYMESESALLARVIEGDFEERKKFDEADNLIERTEIRRRSARMAAWLLEKRFPEKYGNAPPVDPKAVTNPLTNAVAEFQKSMPEV